MSEGFAVANYKTDDHASLVANRYDRFQQQAVDQIVSDFRDKPNGRFLLVVPTGGGKTFTAVKSINRLFESGVLDPTLHRVLWVAHRDYLLEQASDTFARFAGMHPDAPNFVACVEFSMVQAATEKSKDPAVRVVVIDEAHHSAAPSYRPLFERGDVGVLGMTATPSRHDDNPLEFERESFSIGFPDLVEFGVVLKPTIISLQGTRVDVAGLQESDYEMFNEEGRNRKIVDGIAQNSDKFRKIVVYVGTVRHVLALYETLLTSPLRERYDIEYITQDGNSLGIPRSEFLALGRSRKRSIVVNVSILAEGYDDPSVDTVVMAVPTQSKLVYMQCMGRAIRHNPDDPEKKAFVVEVADDLPNIRYRIDNRWMYSEISDDLEPAVQDSWYESEKDFFDKLSDIYERFGVAVENRAVPEYGERTRYGLLLFKYYTSKGFRHLPVLIDDDNRLAVTNFYNYFSRRALGFCEKGYTAPELLRQVTGRPLPRVAPSAWPTVLEGMLNAASVVQGGATEAFRAPHPWITYVAFRYRRSTIPAELLQVVATLKNQTEIRKTIEERRYRPGAVLLRAELPLGGYWGRVMDSEEAAALSRYTDNLMIIRDADEGFEQYGSLAKYIGASVFPLEQVYLHSALALVRSNERHRYDLP